MLVQNLTYETVPLVILLRTEEVLLYYELFRNGTICAHVSTEVVLILIRQSSLR